MKDMTLKEIIEEHWAHANAFYGEDGETAVIIVEGLQSTEVFGILKTQGHEPSVEKFDGHGRVMLLPSEWKD